MSDETSEERAELTTLEGVRACFEARQRASGKGFHALGEEVLATFFHASTALPRPASAMTFRNFLQGKTTLRDPTALELYFRALGASDAEMRTIRSTLQQELDRRLASPRHQAALKPFDALDLDDMPYSRALVECEVVTKLEGSFAGPITHLTPREYLFGPDGQRDAGPDPERWGLVQHLEELTRYMANLDQRLIERLESIPRKSARKRQLQACADLREVAGAYAHWLLHRPRGAELLFSRRRYMLHGLFPEGQREVAVALAKRVARIVFSTFDRSASEVLFAGKQGAPALKTPEAECALERAAERLLAIVNGFYVTVVQGSVGTGAMFQASYQLRRESSGVTHDWSPAHDRLIERYTQAVIQANQAIQQDVRVPYGQLKQIYERHFAEAQKGMAEVWERSYAPSLVRESLSLLLGELHAAKVLRDADFLKLSQELFTGAAGRELMASHSPRALHERLDRP